MDPEEIIQRKCKAACCIGRVNSDSPRVCKRVGRKKWGCKFFKILLQMMLKVQQGFKLEYGNCETFPRNNKKRGPFSISSCNTCSA